MPASNMRDLPVIRRHLHVAYAVRHVTMLRCILLASSKRANKY